MPGYSTDSYGRRDRARHNGRRDSAGGGHGSWRASMERGARGYDGEIEEQYRKSWTGSNGHTGAGSYSDDAPTLPRRTLRGQPPPGARKVQQRRRRNYQSWTAGIYIAASCSVLCLLLLAVALGTRFWIQTNVDREALAKEAQSNTKLETQLQTDRLYRSSHRGLFSVCWEGLNADDPEECESEKGYELSRRTETTSWGTDYELYIHLMRLVLVSICLALLFQLLALLVAVLGCLRKSRRTLLITVALGFFGFLFSCGGMGSFSGIDHYERERLHHEPYPADWPDSHPRLAEHYDRSFGYSFFLGWVAAALSFVALVCFIVAYIALGRHKARFPTPLKKKDPMYANVVNGAAPQGTNPRPARGRNGRRGMGRGGSRGPNSALSDEADTYYTTSSAASRNFAYEMAEKDIPPPDELDCIDESIFSESTKL